MFKKSKGFTLIELLVVIAIIGILATIVTVSLSSARAKSRDATRISELNSLKTAMELYYDNKSQYPYPVTNNCWLRIEPGAANCGGASVNFSTEMASYLPKMPADPLNKPNSLNRYEIFITSRENYIIRTRVEDSKNANTGTRCYVVSNQTIPSWVGNQAFCN